MSARAGSVDPKLREVAVRLGREIPLRLIVLFGSTVRSDRSPEDLDLAVLGDEPVDSVALTNRFAVALGRSDVDLVDLRRADPLLQMQVAEHGVPLYESALGAFASFVSLAFRRFQDTRKLREVGSR